MWKADAYNYRSWGIGELEDEAADCENAATPPMGHAANAVH
jgi:hypothetical protein